MIVEFFLGSSLSYDYFTGYICSIIKADIGTIEDRYRNMEVS